MSSINAQSTFNVESDWQLISTLRPYEASKFQVEVLASELDKQSIGESPRVAHCASTTALPVRHFIASPGIVPTEIITRLDLGIPWWRYIIRAALLLVRHAPLSLNLCCADASFEVRLLGSPHIHMSIFAAALVPVHLSLAPLWSFPNTLHFREGEGHKDSSYPSWHPYADADNSASYIMRFGTESDWIGNPRPGVTYLPVSNTPADMERSLLTKCENLYVVVSSLYSGA